jgi:hypothetical protein
MWMAVGRGRTSIAAVISHASCCMACSHSARFDASIRCRHNPTRPPPSSLVLVAISSVGARHVQHVVAGGGCSTAGVPNSV